MWCGTSGSMRSAHLRITYSRELLLARRSVDGQLMLTELFRVHFRERLCGALRVLDGLLHLSDGVAYGVHPLFVPLLLYLSLFLQRLLGLVYERVPGLFLNFLLLFDDLLDSLLELGHATARRLACACLSYSAHGASK